MPVAIDGIVNLESPAGRTAVLAADGATLRFSVGDWQDLHSLGPRSLFATRRLLAKATGLLAQLNVGLSVDIAGRPVMQIGTGVKASPLARLLGLRATALSFSTALMLLRTRRSR